MFDSQGERHRPQTRAHFTVDGSTLIWSVFDATGVSIDQGVGDVALQGTTTLSPSETTTYTLTATKDGVTRHATVQVEVDTPSGARFGVARDLISAN